MPVQEVFVFWNAKVVFDTLNALVGLLGTDEYSTLIRSLGIAMFMVAAMGCIMALNGTPMLKHFAGLFLVWSVVFVPKTTVIVNDLRTAQVYTVSGVPVGLAVPYASISRIGWWLTMQYETRFSLPDDQRFSKSGMVFGARIAEALSVQNYPPELKADMRTFYKDCIVPELQDFPQRASELRESNDIMGLLTNSNFLNPARGTVFGTITNPATGDTTMSCVAVPGAFTQYLTSHPAVGTKNFAGMGAFLRPQQMSSSTALASIIETDTNNMLGTMTAISSSAVEALNQTMAINGLHDASFAVRNGYGSPTATAYAAAVAENAARQSAYAGKLWAEKALPLTRNVAEVMLLAIFPIVLLLGMVAGERAIGAFKLYFGAMLSLTLWAPLTAVLNSVVIANGIDSANVMLAASQGFTLNNLNAWVDMNMTTQALAGQMFLAVPVLAFGLVTAGGYALTQAIGGATASAAQAAGSVGGSMAQGNVSGGQVQWMNQSALNKSYGQQSTVPSYRAGFATSETAGGTQTFGAGSGGNFGQTVSSMRGDQLGAVGGSINRSLQNAFSQSAEASLSAARSALSEVSNSIKQATGSGWKSDIASQLASKIDSTLSNGSTADIKRLAKESNEIGQSGGFESRRQESDTRTAGANAGLGANGSGANLGLSMGVSESSAQTSGGHLDHSGSLKQSGGLDMSSGTSASKTSSVGNSATNSNSTSNGSYGSLDRAKDAANRASANAQSAERASEALSASRSDGGSVSSGIARQVIDKMGGHDAAMSLANKDMGAFNAKAEQAAMAVVREAGFGPTTSRQLEGASGDTPVSSSAVQSNMQATEQKASSQIKGAPDSARAPGGGFRDPETGGMATGETAAGAGGGTSSASGSSHSASGGGSSAAPARPGSRAGGSRASHADAPVAPGQPTMPALPQSVPDAANGSGNTQITTHQVRGTNDARMADIEKRVSDSNAETSRKSGNAQGEGSDRTTKTNSWLSWFK